jgi:uncharacterized protein YtpQ (UPF0354 family)
MSAVENDRVESEIAETLKRFEDSRLSRDAVFLLIAKLLELRNPDKSVSFTEEDAIGLTHSDGATTHIYLHNLWSECQRYPEDRLEIVERYLRGLVPDASDDSQEITRDNVIALVRDATYTEFVKDDDRSVVTEHLLADLWIVLAADLPDSTIILTKKDIRTAKIDSQEIRTLGVENIARLLGDIELEPYGACFILRSETALYLASALLLDYLWEHAANMVEGDLVVALPARDTVLFTGALNAAGLRLIREEVDHVFSTGHHLITRTFFRRVGGKWTLFS